MRCFFRKPYSPIWFIPASVFALLALVSIFGTTSGTVVASSRETCPARNLNGLVLRYTAKDLDSAKSHTTTGGGSIDIARCEAIHGGSGRVQRAPNFSLHYSGQESRASLEFRITSDCDSILLINDPNNDWYFDDDSNDNMDAKLRLANAKDGVYRIWVGKLGGGDCNATLEIETFGPAVSRRKGACPNPSADGKTLRHTAQELQSKKTHPIEAGGALDLGNCDSLPGTGYISRTPDFSLQYSGGNTSMDLEIAITSECDSVLLVQAPGNRWLFDDDSNEDLDAKLRIPNARDGTYKIWVGKIDSGTCKARMHLETSLSSSKSSPAVCPDGTLNGKGLAYTAKQLDKPASHDVEAGGPINLTQCDSLPGDGFVAREPDFTLSYSGGKNKAALEFRTQSECDTILLVLAPNNTWHFDDDGGDNLNALLRLAKAGDGTYRIWVGTASEGTCQTEFILETF